MADWKYGTVLQREGEGETYVMVVGKNQSDERFLTTDGHNGVAKDQWIGVTVDLPVYADDDGGPWGKPGDTTWLLDDEWTVVE